MTEHRMDCLGSGKPATFVAPGGGMGRCPHCHGWLGIYPTKRTMHRHHPATNADYEAVVLASLQREGVPLKPSEIARWEDITPGSVRRAMVRLEAKGVVFRNSNGYCELSHNDGSEP